MNKLLILISSIIVSISISNSMEKVNNINHINNNIDNDIKIQIRELSKDEFINIRSVLEILDNNFNESHKNITWLKSEPQKYKTTEMSIEHIIFQLMRFIYKKVDEDSALSFLGLTNDKLVDPARVNGLFLWHYLKSELAELKENNIDNLYKDISNKYNNIKDCNTRANDINIYVKAYNLNKIASMIYKIKTELDFEQKETKENTLLDETMNLNFEQDKQDFFLNESRVLDSKQETKKYNNLKKNQNMVLDFNQEIKANNNSNKDQNLNNAFDPEKIKTDNNLDETFITDTKSITEELTKQSIKEIISNPQKHQVEYNNIVNTLLKQPEKNRYEWNLSELSNDAKLIIEAINEYYLEYKYIPLFISKYKTNQGGKCYLGAKVKHALAFFENNNFNEQNIKNFCDKEELIEYKNKENAGLNYCFYPESFPQDGFAEYFNNENKQLPDSIIETLFDEENAGVDWIIYSNKLDIKNKFDDKSILSYKFVTAFENTTIAHFNNNDDIKNILKKYAMLPYMENIINDKLLMKIFYNTKFENDLNKKQFWQKILFNMYKIRLYNQFFLSKESLLNNINILKTLLNSKESLLNNINILKTLLNNIISAKENKKIKDLNFSEFRKQIIDKDEFKRLTNRIQNYAYVSNNTTDKNTIDEDTTTNLQSFIKKINQLANNNDEIYSFQKLMDKLAPSKIKKICNYLVKYLNEEITKTKEEITEAKEELKKESKKLKEKLYMPSKKTIIWENILNDIETNNIINSYNISMLDNAWVMDRIIELDDNMGNEFTKFVKTISE